MPDTLCARSAQPLPHENAEIKSRQLILHKERQMSLSIFRRLCIFTHMLQNRVDPHGNIIKTPAGGAWMGIRGIIHNKRNEIVRPFQNKTWLTCRTEFKNRRLPVMAPNTY